MIALVCGVTPTPRPSQGTQFSGRSSFLKTEMFEYVVSPPRLDPYLPSLPQQLDHPYLVHCGPSKLFQASKSCLDGVWEPSLTVFPRTINPGLRVSQTSIMLLEPEPQDTIQTFKVGNKRKHFPGEPWEGMLGSFITYDLGAITFLRLHGSLHIPVQ